MPTDAVPSSEHEALLDARGGRAWWTRLAPAPAACAANTRPTAAASVGEQGATRTPPENEPAADRERPLVGHPLCHARSNAYERA